MPLRLFGLRLEVDLFFPYFFTGFPPPDYQSATAGLAHPHNSRVTSVLMQTPQWPNCSADELAAHSSRSVWYTPRLHWLFFSKQKAANQDYSTQSLINSSHYTGMLESKLHVILCRMDSWCYIKTSYFSTFSEENCVPSFLGNNASNL